MRGSILNRKGKLVIGTFLALTLNAVRVSSSLSQSGVSALDGKILSNVENNLIQKADKSPHMNLISGKPSNSTTISRVQTHFTNDEQLINDPSKTEPWEVTLNVDQNELYLSNSKNSNHYLKEDNKEKKTEGRCNIGI